MDRVEEDLVLDGFVRSGTTFLEECLKYAYPQYTIYTKLHQTSRAEYGIKNNIPTFFCIRNPIKSIPSWLVYDGIDSSEKNKINDVFKWYKRFAEFALKHNNQLILIDVDIFKKNPYLVLDRVSKDKKIDMPIFFTENDIINILSEKYDTSLSDWSEYGWIPRDLCKKRKMAEDIILSQTYYKEFNEVNDIYNLLEYKYLRGI